MVNATTPTQPTLPPTPYLAEAQALLAALAKLAQPEQNDPNSYGDIINSLRGNRVAAMYQQLMRQGMDQAKAQATIQAMANWLGGGGVGPKTPITLDPGERQPDITLPNERGLPVPATGSPKVAYPIGVPPALNQKIDINYPFNERQGTGNPQVAYPAPQVPAGNVLASRLPASAGNFTANQARLRQLLGLSPVAAAISAKLRGG
jgi:hypothetical protein